MKFCVIGIGKFGYQVAKILSEQDIDVLAIDSDEAKIEHIRDKVTQAICIKIIDAESLYQVGIEEMDGVIIALPGNFSDSAVLVRTLKKEFKISTIITCADSTQKAEILEQLGADQTIKPEIETATRLAESLTSPFPIMTKLGEHLSVIQMEAPNKFLGKTFAEILIYENYRVHCIAIRRDEEVIIVHPELQVQEGDSLLFAGFRQDLEGLLKL